MRNDHCRLTPRLLDNSNAFCLSADKIIPGLLLRDDRGIWVKEASLSQSFYDAKKQRENNSNEKGWMLKLRHKFNTETWSRIAELRSIACTVTHARRDSFTKQNRSLYRTYQWWLHQLRLQSRPDGPGNKQNKQRLIIQEVNLNSSFTAVLLSNFYNLRWNEKY